MELRRYLRLVRQRLLLVVVAIIAGAGVGYAITSRTPVYTATATLFVGSTNLGPNQEFLYQEADLNQIVNTYAVMIPDPVIAQKAIDQTHINRFAGSVAAETSAQVITNTQLISVSVADTSAADAIQLANAVSSAFVSQIKDYQVDPTATGSVPSEPAHVYQDATYASASSSGLTKRIILGSAFGLVLSVFLVLLLDYLDITIKSADELERRLDLPVLGIVPRFTSLPLDTSPGAPSAMTPRVTQGATRG
jgi:capsular polysaccharide biosynthesis protein